MGWLRDFVGSESGQIQSVKFLHNTVSRPTSYPPPPPYTLNIQFMYLRAILCTFQISVDFYYVPVGGRGGGRGGAGGNRERVIECILYGGYS